MCAKREASQTKDDGRRPRHLLFAVEPDESYKDRPQKMELDAAPTTALGGDDTDKKGLEGGLRLHRRCCLARRCATSLSVECRRRFCAQRPRHTPLPTRFAHCSMPLPSTHSPQRRTAATDTRGAPVRANIASDSANTRYGDGAERLLRHSATGDDTIAKSSDRAPPPRVLLTDLNAAAIDSALRADTPTSFHRNMLSTARRGSKPHSPQRGATRGLAALRPCSQRMQAFATRRPLSAVFVVVLCTVALIMVLRPLLGVSHASNLLGGSPWSILHRNRIPRPNSDALLGGTPGDGSVVENGDNDSNNGDSDASLYLYETDKLNEYSPYIDLTKTGPIPGPRIVPIDLKGYYDNYYKTHQDTEKDVLSERINAAFVILCTNDDIDGIRHSLRQLEDRFNRVYQYPYVFLNEEPFTEEFKRMIGTLTKAKVEYGFVDPEAWSIPPHVDKEKAIQCMERMASQGVYKGGSLSYRHMCRFYSGFFFKHPLVAKYEFYWRVEPGVEFYCDIKYDPFRFLKENNKVYGFSISFLELLDTIPNLWDLVRRFAIMKGYTGANADLMPYFINSNLDSDSSQRGDEVYNGCHFWTNFEISRVDIWTDPEYVEFFEFLDHWGGFFYERWGDAPIRSLWLGMRYKHSQVHFFHDIGYSHDRLYHCFESGALYDTCQCPDPLFSTAHLAELTCSTRWMSYVPGPWKANLNGFHKSSVNNADERFESWAEKLYKDSDKVSWISADTILANSVD